MQEQFEPSRSFAHPEDSMSWMEHGWRNRLQIETKSTSRLLKLCEVHDKELATEAK
jgi:hypothetical protein